METYKPASSRYQHFSMPLPAEDSIQGGTVGYRRCGHSGLLLPMISLGMWHNFGGAGSDAGRHTDETAMHENCRRMMRTAFDLGITHFDLANNYGPPPGSAEERVGRVLKQDFSSHRDELIISTKAGWGMWPGPYGDFASRKYLIASLDQSLKRLGLEYVDIFYHHRPDPGATPMEETLGALDTIVRQGKAIYAGVSSYSGSMAVQAVQICERAGLVKPVIHQPNYNILDRWVEKELLPGVSRHGMGVIAFCPLAQGLLTEKYLHGVPEDSRAKSTGGFLREAHIKPEQLEKIRKLSTLAQARGQTLAQMSLAWVLRRREVTSALIGASRPQQIIENVKACANLKFSDEELKAIDAAVA